MEKKIIFFFSLITIIVLAFLLFINQKVPDQRAIKKEESTSKQEMLFNTTPVQYKTLNEKERKVPISNTNMVKPDISALSVDKLLNQSDKNSENKLTIHNHRNLLLAIEQSNSLRSNQIKSPTIEQVTRWIQILINDAYLNNEIGHKNMPLIDLTKNTSIRLDLIPEEDNSSWLISKSYIKELRSLAEKVSSLNNSLSDKALTLLGVKAIGLIKRRKKQSDVFYLSMMRKYYLDESLTVTEKISFTKQFVDAGDKHLAYLSIDYFKDALNNPNFNKDHAKIQRLITSIEQGNKK